MPRWGPQTAPARTRPGRPDRRHFDLPCRIWYQLVLMDFGDENREPSRRYSRTQTARGLSRVPVWVPRARANELRRFAARLRRDEGILLPRESAESEPASRPSPVPPGPDISSEQLLELMAAARDEPPEKTLSDICVGRGPIGIAAALARIAGRLGYALVWRREIAEELAELRSRWIGAPNPVPAPAQPDPESPPSAPSRNGPCPCGSGKKYKRCCATDK